MTYDVRLKVGNGSYTRRLDQMFPGYFAGIKHNHYADFGFPNDPTFQNFFDMYERNGLARAAVDKTVAKTWQDFPFLLEKPRDAGGQVKETRREGQLRQRFEDLRLWQQLAECDRRGMVGAYSGLILRLADDKAFDQPVDMVPGGLEGLFEVIPAWEGQLQVSQWDTDQASHTYGQPLLFQFNESAFAQSKQPRSFIVHPDRVLVWSRDGTVNNISALKSGYNDLMTVEKIVGAGGEGFWKIAKAAPVLAMDKDVDIRKVAAASGMDVTKFMAALDEHIDAFNAGFDKYLMMQGVEAKTLGIVLPSPEHFFAAAVQCFAASMSIPMKILVGTQTGERASTEDAQEWNQTGMARRQGMVIPNIMSLVRKFERFGMAPERDWSLAWTPLTEATPGEKLDRAVKMATANKDMQALGERVFTGGEIRSTVDLEPLSEADAKVEPPPTPDPAPADPTAPAKE